MSRGREVEHSRWGRGEVKSLRLRLVVDFPCAESGAFCLPGNKSIQLYR